MVRQKKSNSYEIYQYLLNISDNDVIDLLKKITLLTPDRIIFLEEETKKILDKEQHKKN